MSGLFSKLLKGAAVAGALAGCLYASPAHADTVVERAVIRTDVPRAHAVRAAWIGGPVVRVGPAFHELAPIRFEPGCGWGGHGGFGWRGEGGHGWGGGHGFGGGHGAGGVHGGGGHGWGSGRR